MKSPALLFGATAIHTLTASGAVVGLFALCFIAQQQFIAALWCMLATLIIDGVDGPLARKIRITQLMPNVDGKTIDQVVDFFNYAIVPAFFLFNWLAQVESSGRYALLTAMVLASCYWYGRVDQYNGPYCFKRFPCLWNALVSYVYLVDASVLAVYITMTVFVVATFIPLSYPTNSGIKMIKDKVLRGVFALMFGAGVGALAYLLIMYPQRPWQAEVLCIAYGCLYMGFSLYVSFTQRPLKSCEHLSRSKYK